MTTEAGKSQDLQLASWRPKRASGVKSKWEGLRTRRADDVSSSPRASVSARVQRQVKSMPGSKGG